MSTARRRRLTAASMAVTAALTLGACGTGFDAQTNQVYQPGVGTNERGDVGAYNALLVGNADGTATLSSAFVNNLEDEQSLTAITVTGADGEELTVQNPRTALALPSGLLIQTGEDAATAFVVTDGAEPGDYVDVTFEFSTSSPQTIEAPVVARSAQYDGIVGGTTASSSAAK